MSRSAVSATAEVLVEDVIFDNICVFIAKFVTSCDVGFVSYSGLESLFSALDRSVVRIANVRDRLFFNLAKLFLSPLGNILALIGLEFNLVAEFY